MCGIIGYIGKNNAIKRVINGLKNLEYRGYDSAGIAFVYQNELKIKKEIGRIVNLEQTLSKEETSSLAIGHTRWATHGGVNQTNSHPHHQGSITLVHNGIIENYATLKEQLQKLGYSFKSDTDSEVACAYIDYLYSKEKDILKTLTQATTILEGSYALGIIVNQDYNTLYALRKDSPLIIGLGLEENFIASDVPAILDYTNKYYLLDDLDIAIITKDKVNIYNNLKEVTKEIQSYDFSLNVRDKQGYEHYMLKEIHEQSNIIRNLSQDYNSKEKILRNLPDLSSYNKINIVACGSAYHAGIVGKYLIEEYGNIPVDVDIASEFRYKKLFLDKHTLVILISQSSETADTLACLRIAKKYGCKTLGIINVEGSSIAREVDEVIYTKAGIEVAVATTKGYLTQTFILSLLALNLGIRNNTLTEKNLEEIFDNLSKLPIIIDNILGNNRTDIANILCNYEDIYFIGRNIDYASSLESSLKLKEISYIHSDTYAAGELKHGSIALIDKLTPVIATITDPNTASKTISNVKEVKARGAYVIVLTTTKLEIPTDCYDEIITLETTAKLFQPILNIIPMQLIAYNVAKLRNCDIDKPKNLAKSVTVE